MVPWRLLRDIFVEKTRDRAGIFRSLLPVRTEPAFPRYEHVAFLNDFVDLPSLYPREAFCGGLDAGVYFLDYGYEDRAKAGACLEAIARLRRDEGLDFSGKTLLLAAAGLDPHGRALLDLTRAFARHHVFFEVWNEMTEMADVLDARLDDFYLLPVTSHLRDEIAPARMPSVPNRRVFVSLGGDDDLDLVQEVVRRRDDLLFAIPDISWEKSAYGRRTFDVRIRGRNVIRVPCKWRIQATFSLAYLVAYAACDTVFVATRPEKRLQMRGGLRVADALRARKRLVLARNPACELLMAQHDRTALVVEHDAASVSAAFDRIQGGGFAVDEALVEEIRALMDRRAKLAWMMRVPLAPEEARRSVFRREPERLRADLAWLAPTTRGAMTTLFGLARGDALPVPGGGAFCVEEMHEEGDGRFVVKLSREGAAATIVEISTAPVERYYLRTARGHWLGYRGEGVTPDERRALEEVARRS